MPRPLSADIRERFRRLFEDGLSGREAARRLMISAASASRLAGRLKHGAYVDGPHLTIDFADSDRSLAFICPAC